MDSYEELVQKTQISAAMLQREVDLSLLVDRLNISTAPTQVQQTSYVAETIVYIRTGTVQHFNNLPRAFRRQLLLALTEHGIYPIGKRYCTQAEKLAGIVNYQHRGGIKRRSRDR
ncbi:hypothetical protein GQ44DRAFT_720494 [Phaeosphaeriaceae sp. PMI808]|nr:hypothetical protein GQ44DRAFT_720494 [Phaeosphaeriaceae sp. PMI808]